MDVETTGARMLEGAGVCSGVLARMLGLVFADRDVELIEYLKGLPREQLPDEGAFPAAEKLAAAVGVDVRRAAFVREKVQRFLHKRVIGGDFSADVRHFEERADVRALAGACAQLKRGTTVFIGDSLMDIRHFSANASFPILVGSLLEKLGVGAWVNAGVGGNTTTQGLARYERDCLSHRPVRIVLSFGSNDLANGVAGEKICGNLAELIERGRAIGAVVVLGMILPVITERLWWCKTPLRNTELEQRRALQAAMNELARREEVACFDLLERMKPEHYCVDGIHINQGGQEVCGVECLRLMVGSIRCCV